MHELTSNLAGSTCEKVLLLIFALIQITMCWYLYKEKNPASAKAKAKAAGKPAKKKAKTGGMHAE